MTIKDKLNLEVRKQSNEIILHREGIFYIAYEYSAWLFTVAVHSFNVKKQYIKCVAQEVVSIGFPMTSLEKFTLDCELVNEGNVVRLLLPPETLFAGSDFEQWKGMQQCTAPKEKPAGEPGAVSVPAKELELLRRIKDFPIECKTPLECMLFLVEVKKQMNNLM